MKKEKITSKKTREEIMRSFDLGEGVTVSMGYGDKIDYFYTNTIKPPQGLPLDLEIEVSSSQTDDAQLLHYLLTKSREH